MFQCLKPYNAQWAKPMEKYQFSEDPEISKPILDQIVLGIAHELNNPNGFIRMNAMNLKKMIALLDPILREAREKDPEKKFGPYTLPVLRGKIHQNLEGILQATVRIIVIADRLKDCTSDALVQHARISLKSLLEDLVKSHDFIIQRCALLDLISDNDCEFEIMGHRLQLEQAFSVLITNACDTISERYNDSEELCGVLTINLTQSEEEYVVSISDNGMGMDKETVEKIFTPYFSTKPQGAGHGLGLAIFKTIIQRHHGRVEVLSEENVETEFRVFLPKAGV